MKPILALVAIVSPLVAGAQSGSTRVPVDDVRVLLISAIDSPTGQAQGVLTGQMASLITDRFKAAGPILIDVTTERRYAQAGCSRLKVRFWQDGVQLPGVPAPRRQTIDFGITWTPTATGAMQIWGEVVLANDGIATNNQTPPLNLVVQQEGIVAVTIGDGSQTARMPMDFFYNNSLSETIYPATDMNIGGLITGVQYYNDFTNANGLMGKPWG